MGYDEIETRIVNVTSILEGELTENEVRKQFTLDERVAIGEALENMVGERRGGDHKSATYQSGNISTLKKKTRDIVSKRVGFGSGRNYEKAKTVSKKATPKQKDRLSF